MKRIIRLTESQLINVVNNIIKEVKTKNIFASSPSSEFINYGIEFIPSGKGTYQVLFLNSMPDEFYSFLDQFDSDIKNEISDSLDRIYIEASGEFNRIHFREGIHPYLKGLGLGYIIYEAFVKYLGFASSSESASQDSKKIWKKLLNDPDFRGITCDNENVLVFDKSYNKNVESISKKFLSNKCQGNA